MLVHTLLSAGRGRGAREGRALAAEAQCYADPPQGMSMAKFLAAIMLVAAPAAAEQAASQPVPVSFCQLVEGASDYDNRRVALAGEIAAGFETFALVDKSCPTDNRAAGMIWLDTKGDGVARYYVGWSIEDFMRAVKTHVLDSQAATLDWRVPIPVSAVPRAELDALDAALKRSEVVRASVTGRFDFVSRGRLTQGADGRLDFSVGFGHLNGFSRRIVVEHIAAIPPAKK